MSKFIILSGVTSLLIYWIAKLIIKKYKLDISREIIKSIFFIYITIVLSITFNNLDSYYALTFDYQFNSIPLKETISMFKNTLSVALYQVGGNILLFIPFGLFIPFLYKKDQNIIKVGFLSFLFSLSIEISQVILGRIGDIDDLIFNTIGGIIGFIIYFILRKIQIRAFNDISRNKTFLRSSAPYGVLIFVYIYLIGVGNVYNFINDNLVPVSEIRSQIIKSNHTIVAEEEIDGYNYIMSYLNKEDKDNIMITSYECDKKYVLDLSQTMITDNLSTDYVYRGLDGEFINYHTQVHKLGENINDITLYIKAEVGDVVELSAHNEKISFTVEEKYMIKNINLHHLELPGDTIFKINLIKNI